MYDEFRSAVLLRVAAVTAALLLIPLIAMSLTDEVAWKPGDFAVAAVLLFASGIAGVVLFRRIRRRGLRVAALAGLGVSLLALWTTLAVGWVA